MAELTPEQFGKKFDALIKGLPQAINKAALVAANELRADISTRVFSPTGTKDVEGNTRGYLSFGHIAERKDKGLQTRVVDHVFNGDLQRSPKLITRNNVIDLRIIGKQNVEKARQNEDLYPSGSVFAASSREEQIAREIYGEELEKYVRKYIG